MRYRKFKKVDENVFSYEKTGSCSYDMHELEVEEGDLVYAGDLYLVRIANGWVTAQLGADQAGELYLSAVRAEREAAGVA